MAISAAARTAPSSDPNEISIAPRCAGNGTVRRVIDENNAIGVMHVGDFPNGTEFATFVLARHNYPLELATDEDRKLIPPNLRASMPPRQNPDHSQTK